MEINKTLEGMGGRYEHILLFEPLCKLTSKRSKDFPEISVFETSVATLVFFLDEMLRGNKVTANSIELFLKELLASSYDMHLTLEEARKLRVYIVDGELRNEGRDFSYEQFDPSLMEIKKVNFKYITREIRGEESYLKLTEKGIEMLFKTREMFSDERINFTVMYFKQQLEKQNFSSSLELARNLIFEIQNEIDRLEEETKRIKTNVMNAVGADGSITKAKNKKMLDTMRNVQKEFSSLYKLIETIKENETPASPGQFTPKQIKKLESLEEINGLIVKSQSKTDIWMTKWLEMTEAIDKAFENVLLTLSSKKYDFETEVLNKYVEKELDSEKLNRFLLPTYPINLKKEYNPMRGFLPQKIRREREMYSEEIVVLTNDQISDSKEIEEQKVRAQYERYVKYSEVLLKPLNDKEYYYANEVMETCAVEYPEVYEELMTDEDSFKQFMFLCGMMHKSTKPILLQGVYEVDITEVFDIANIVGRVVVKMPNLTVRESFEVFGTDETILLDNGYEITNFVVTKGEE